MRPKLGEGLEQALASRIGFVVRRHGGRSRRICIWKWWWSAERSRRLKGCCEGTEPLLMVGARRLD